MPDSSASRLEELIELAKSVGLETDQAQLELLEEGVGYLEEYLKRLEAHRGLDADPAHISKLLNGNS
tara:strand:- start:603 stop:803 length:201 start_codon:yes stop_codon:yes gene_type:complete